MQEIEHRSLLRLANGEPFVFAKGRRNSLIVDIVELFVPRYAPNTTIVHLLDIANSVLLHERDLLTRLHVPNLWQDEVTDLVLYDEPRNKLFLIDSLTLHGVMTARRKNELEKMFRGCGAEKVYVSALYGREDYLWAMSQLAQGIQVWLADWPERMICSVGNAPE